MIAKLVAAGDIVAELGDDGVWTVPDAESEFFADMLNLQFDPREETLNKAGDHHAGWGCEQARLAAIEFDCDVEYEKREPLPEGSIS